MNFRYAVTLLLPLFFLQSCNNKGKESASEENAGNDTLVKMAPYDEDLPALTSTFITNHKYEIGKFAHKLWSKNDNISFIVAKNGQIIYEQYQGFADQKKEREIDRNTPLHIASVSKIMTAAVILKLVDAGKIELDQKVNTILTTFPYPDVTVKTLLNHRSGLRKYEYFTSDKKVWNMRDKLTNEDILRLMGEKEIKLEYKTDTRFTYCNTNYAMLALIIERVTGLKYGEAMRRMVFDPLGMKHTYVFDYDRDRDSTSISFYANGYVVPYDFLDNVYGDKNIYSTPTDLMKFDLATYSGKFLKPSLVKQVYKGYSYEKEGTRNYGLGIRIKEWVTGQKFYFHNGWWHGNTSGYSTLRKEKVTIIALSNKKTFKTFQTRKIAPMFGDYPFEPDDKAEN
ncbi:MAG TPA: serine hydrolase domain-containing protein [Flavobacterium sp.]|jgi:CubicO group peptidase (beta-lactamase class C family)